MAEFKGKNRQLWAFLRDEILFENLELLDIVDVEELKIYKYHYNMFCNDKK
jgi:hypothetical protein